LDILRSWAKTWQLNYNEKKCQVMHFDFGNSKYLYCMYDVPLESVSAVKDLGVLVDDKLSFSCHIYSAVLKANPLLGLLKRFFGHMDKMTLTKLYKATVRPHLEYANIVWHPKFKKDVENLEKVQHRFTRFLPGLQSLTYEERLCHLQLPSLVNRRLRGDAIETYKYLHNMHNAGCSTFFAKVDQCGMKTRGHSYKLQKFSCHTELRSNFYALMTVNRWNSLSEAIVNAPSVNAFKNRLDKHWSHLMFSMECEG
jgi:ribonuclease P/MRP protein subunit RPP40